MTDPMQLPEHIRENSIVSNSVGEELHIVAIEETRVLLRRREASIITTHAKWPFTVAVYRFVREATSLEIVEGQQLLNQHLQN